MEGKHSFGDRLKQVRLDRKLSQEQMARMLGTSKQVLSRYENNQRNPKVSVTVEFAQILGVSLSWLTGERKDEYIEGIEGVMLYHWSWPLVEAYLNADSSTRKAVCAVLGLDYILENQTWKDRIAYKPSVHEMSGFSGRNREK